LGDCEYGSAPGQGSNSIDYFLDTSIIIWQTIENTFHFFSYMAKILNPVFVQDTLVKNNLYVFSPLEFQRLFNVSPKAATFFIFDHSKKNLFSKLRNGLYALSSHLPSELEVANRLYKPSYVSFEYALSYYHIIPETVFTITSATTKPTREFQALGNIYHYYKIKRELYFGYEPKIVNGVTVFIATPEKAFVDYMYFVSLKKKSLNERLSLDNLDIDSTFEYLKIFDKKNLTNLVKRIV
jgi:predicted transcriptional regulator of viral defense system